MDPHREIKALVDNFVADLSELAKRIAIEHLKTAFAAGTQVATSAPRSAPRPAPRPAPAPRSRARRGQREIAALQGKLLATIAEQPGRRAEDLGSALGTKTAQIAQPLRRLVVERLVRTEGARRGTRYFVVGSADVQHGRRATVEAAAAAAVTNAANASNAANAANAAGAPSTDDPPGPPAPLG